MYLSPVLNLICEPNFSSYIAEHFSFGAISPKEKWP